MLEGHNYSYKKAKMIIFKVSLGMKTQSFVSNRREPPVDEYKKLKSKKNSTLTKQELV